MRSGSCDEWGVSLGGGEQDERERTGRGDGQGGEGFCWRVRMGRWRRKCIRGWGNNCVRVTRCEGSLFNICMTISLNSDTYSGIYNNEMKNRQTGEVCYKKWVWAIDGVCISEWRFKCTEFINHTPKTPDIHCRSGESIQERFRWLVKEGRRRLLEVRSIYTNREGICKFGTNRISRMKNKNE